MNFDVVVETVRALLTALIVVYLWREGKTEKLLQQKGWVAILAGFCLILFASLLDITDNFPGLNQYVFIGKTHSESFLEKIVGYLGGTILVFIGFTHWCPIIANLANTQAELKEKTLALELTVLNRTSELLEKTETLEEEKKLLAEAEKQISQLAYYDTLTQLPNRRLLNDRISQAMAACKRSDSYGALMFLDMDNFKPLNDTYGHNTGDMLLVEVANRLKNCVREVDTLARFGGDEFVVLLSELDADRTKATSLARIVAEKIRSALSVPYILAIDQEGQQLAIEHRCTASIGVVVFLDHESSRNDILKCADMAMYKAKNDGHNQIWFHDPDFKPA